MISKNKKAYFDYKISDEFEAGLVLSGPEVKSVKKGSIDLKGSYIEINKKEEAEIVNLFIAPYKPARSVQKDYNPNSPRKLLLTKKEIRFLIGKSKEKGISIIPLEIFLKNRLIKIKIGVGKGKKKFDKREDIKKKDFDRRKLRSLMK
jgi:SsrA-binding protein